MGAGSKAKLRHPANAKLVTTARPPSDEISVSNECNILYFRPMKFIPATAIALLVFLNPIISAQPNEQEQLKDKL